MLQPSELKSVSTEYGDNSLLSENMSLGRFTVHGDDAVETTISQMVIDISERFRETLSPNQYRTLALIGGYGRGEGGVEKGPDGNLIPHNNFDFLLIVRDGMAPSAITRLKAKLDEMLKQAMADYGIELYLGVVAERTLHHAPRRILWHDIVVGHKTLLGDPFYLPNLKRHADPKRILPEDVRDLLVNRGTLLLINDLILEKGEEALTAKDRRVVLRHGMKAILGYGDALLWSLGDYHWSYVERQRCMRTHTEIPSAIRDLYEEAAQFRFYPRYEDYLHRDLTAWQTQTRTIMESVHHDFEARRLCEYGTADWKTMLVHALAACLPTSRTDPHLIVKRVWNAMHPPKSVPPGANLRTRFGMRFTSMRDLLPILFPVIAYPESTDTMPLREWVQSVLGAQSTTPESLRRAYLRTWGQSGDVNFPHTLRVLGLSLEEKD